MKFISTLFLTFTTIIVLVKSKNVPSILDSLVPNQKHLNLLNQQNLQAILISIDSKLQSYDQFCTMQMSNLQSKFNYFERKMDKVEKEILRIEMRIKNELDKISENISNRNYRDELLSDRIGKKIESTFDRLSNKYGNIESFMDLISLKIQNTRDVIVSKIDKIDESLYIRDEENAAEMEDTVEDLKKICNSVEENIINKTQDHFLKISKRQETPLITDDNKINGINYESSNRSESTHQNCSQIELLLDKNKLDIEDSVNDFTNKVTDMKYNIEETLDNFKLSLGNVINLLNTTKNEQQNNFRELTIMIGRKIGNKQNLSNTTDCLKMNEFGNKIEKNFKKLFAAQNTFSENCYKLQMDESQIESKISFMLEKIIENLDSKKTLKSDDLIRLEKSLFVHDLYIRRHIYELTRRIGLIVKKMTEDKNSTSEIKQFIHEEIGKLNLLSHKIDNIIEKNTNQNEKLEKNIKKLEENLENLNKSKNYMEFNNSENITVATTTYNYDNKSNEDILSFELPIDVRIGTTINNENNLCNSSDCFNKIKQDNIKIEKLNEEHQTSTEIFLFSKQDFVNGSLSNSTDNDFNSIMTENNETLNNLYLKIPLNFSIEDNDSEIEENDYNFNKSLSDNLEPVRVKLADNTELTQNSKHTESTLMEKRFSEIDEDIEYQDYTESLKSLDVVTDYLFN